MTDDTEQNACSPSTTTQWEWRKVERRPQGPADSGPKAHLRALQRLRRTETVTLSVRFRGGSELWWEIRARGRVWRRPGHLALHDVLVELYEGTGGKTQ